MKDSQNNNIKWFCPKCGLAPQKEIKTYIVIFKIVLFSCVSLRENSYNCLLSLVSLIPMV
jgi:hypothetical protein